MSKIIVTVERPVLTPEERERRMEEIKQATAVFMKAVDKGRSEKEWKQSE